MYQCERCGGTFAHFKTPGQCPLCGVWASVRCTACGHTAHANVFINNADRCPQCGARVSVPGAGVGCSPAVAGWLFVTFGIVWGIATIGAFFNEPGKKMEVPGAIASFAIFVLPSILIGSYLLRKRKERGR